MGFKIVLLVLACVIEQAVVDVELCRKLCSTSYPALCDPKHAVKVRCAATDDAFEVAKFWASKIFVVPVTRGRRNLTKSDGLRCYACGFSSVDSDRNCLTITNDTRTVDCPNTYCTILRQEFLDPVGEVASFNRGCESQPDFLNHEITDSTFRTFYRACTSDLCNTGNGIQSVTGGNLSPTSEYNGKNLLVPGTGSAVNIQISLVMLLLSIFVINIT